MDKRTKCVFVDPDADYEEIVKNIKTKEFKIDDMSDIEAVLNLNPGNFDDFYVPKTRTNIERIEEVVWELVNILDHFDPNSLVSHNHNNYERPIEIDTLPGMDYNEDTKTDHIIEILYRVNSELRRLYNE